MAEPVVGEIRMLAGNSVPPGWAACDGQELQIRDYRELYAVLGATYGGDGKTTFALPDLRGRVAVHSNPGSMNPGATGGEKVHRLTSSEIPGHAHGPLGLIGSTQQHSGVQMAASASLSSSTSTATSTAIAPVTSASSAGEGHDNLQPYMTVTYVIALHGVSPSRK